MKASRFLTVSQGQFDSDLRREMLQQLLALDDVDHSINSVEAFLEGRSDADQASNLVTVVLDSLLGSTVDSQSVCIVCDELDETVRWLSVVRFWLPVVLASRVSMSVTAVWPQPVVDLRDRGAPKCSVAGLVNHYLDLSAREQGLVLFDFSRGDFPARRASPLPELSDRAFGEARLLTETIDSLAKRVPTPFEYDDFRVLVDAASALHNDRIQTDRVGPLVDWLASHALELGAPRTEGIARSLPNEELTSEQLVTLAAAGVCADCSTGQAHYQELLIERAIEQTLDETMPLPVTPLVEWTPEVLDRARAQMDEGIVRSSTWAQLRLLQLAQGLGVQLSGASLRSVGMAIPAQLAEAGRWPAVPAGFAAEVAQGLIDGLEQHPMPVDLIPALVVWIRTSGVVHGLDGMDLLQHPLAWAFEETPRLGLDTDRLEFIDRVLNECDPMSDAVYDEIFAVVWTEVTITLDGMRSLIAGLPRPIESVWLERQFHALVLDAPNTDQLFEIERVIRDAGLERVIRSIAVTALDSVHAIAMIRRTQAQDRMEQFSGAWRLVSDQPGDSRAALAHQLGRCMYLVDGYSLLQFFGDVEASDSRSRELLGVMCSGATASIRLLRPSDRTEDHAILWLTTLAPALLRFKRGRELASICEDLDQEWTEQLINRVAHSIGCYVDVDSTQRWMAWARKCLPHPRTRESGGGERSR
jgi:hypothetical protein